MLIHDTRWVSGPVPKDMGRFISVFEPRQAIRRIDHRLL